MEVVREFVDASKLASFMTLPKTFYNRKLEVIVMPVEETAPVESKVKISETVQSLIGAIPNDNHMTLDDYRRERLSKYETAD